MDRCASLLFFLASLAPLSSSFGLTGSIERSPSLWNSDGTSRPPQASFRVGWLFLDETRVVVPTIGSPQFRVFHSTFMQESGGLDLDQGHYFLLGSEVSGSWNHRVGLSVTMLGGTDENGSAWYHLPKAHLDLRLGSSLFQVGRIARRWGQSFVAPLLLSDNGTSFDSVGWQTFPQVLPWFLKDLGQARAEVFYARTNASRVTAHEHFLGWRLGFNFTENSEFNFGALYEFLGRGVPGGTATDILTEILGSRGENSQSPHAPSNITNRSGSFDFRLKWPDLRWPLEFYGENHLEDCCGGFSYLFFSQLSYLYGIHLKTGRSSSHSTVLDLEYAKTGDKIYYHLTWPSALSNDGTILGHPLGSDAQGVYLQISRWMTSQLQTSSRLFWEERARRGEVDTGSIRSFRPTFQESEKRAGLLPKVAYTLNQHSVLEFNAGVYKIWNKENVRGRDTFEWSTYVGVKSTLR